MKKLLLSALTVTAATCALGKDLGVQGNLWEIIEVDMRRAMVESAARVDWAKINSGLKGGASRYVDSLPTRRLPVAAQTELSWVDPSITVQADIQSPVKQPDGSWKWELLFRKGDKRNPLMQQPPLTAMLFIDGSDEDQVQLARTLLKVEEYRIQVVEAGAGNVAQGTAALRRPVFYANDQMINRFRVSKLPTLVFANQQANRGYYGLLSLAKPFDLQAGRVWDGLAEKLSKLTKQ